MRKPLSLFVIVILLCLSACSIHTPNGTDTMESSTTESSSETVKTDNATASLLPLPEETLEFSFLSGAGAWRTVITLDRSGAFTGFYLDSEMGNVGENYPNGSAYICNFSGKFQNITKINDYSYQMTLAELHTQETVGEEWIEDGIRYIASAPNGLTGPLNNHVCTDFIFYLPDTPVDQVPQEFLFWWPYRYLQAAEAKTTLSCYGILNVATSDGFFTAE